jgi:5,10-methylenetetrahydrofolate reductase
MKISYELNPPKIASDGLFNYRHLEKGMETLRERASLLKKHTDGIHLTDSVLGVPRVSGISAAARIGKAAGDLKISCSLRTSDRNVITLSQAAIDSVMVGIDSLLLLMGDAPTDGRASGLKPSQALALLRDQGFDRKVKLDLSFPAKIPDKWSPAIQAKLAARPRAFVTQSISSLSDLADVVDLAKQNSIGVTACVMVPSIKNTLSAKMIGLDWSGYEKEPVEFVKKAGRLAGSVLLTSPGSFSAGLDLLKMVS